MPRRPGRRGPSAPRCTTPCAARASTTRPTWARRASPYAPTLPGSTSPPARLRSSSARTCATRPRPPSSRRPRDASATPTPSRRASSPTSATPDPGAMRGARGSGGGPGAGLGGAEFGFALLFGEALHHPFRLALDEVADGEACHGGHDEADPREAAQPGLGDHAQVVDRHRGATGPEDAAE